MNLISGLLFLLLFTSPTGVDHCAVTQVSASLPSLESELLPSGFYLINDSTGSNRVIKGTEEYCLVGSKPALPISHVARVKLTKMKSIFGHKGEKSYSILFELDETGRIEMEKLSRIALSEKKRIGLVIQGELLDALFVNQVLDNGRFIHESGQSKASLKKLVGIVKAELNNL